MSLAIRAWEEPTAEEWDRTWAACPGATWYESRAWAEVWRDVTGGAIAPAPKVAVFSDARRALLPLSRRRIWLGLGHAHELCPAGTYGGWLCGDPLTSAHTDLLARHLAREVANLTWRVDPFGGLTLPADIAVEPDVTHALDLRGGLAPIEARWRTSGNARKIRKARDAGVCVEPATCSDDWRAYYDVYREALARWGDAASSRYEWPLFERLSACAPDAVRLWLARRAGRVVAGALCFYAPRHVSYWHGAARAADFEYRPVNLLMAEAIAHACAGGHAWFDLNPSGGHAGVQRFKESLGAAPMPAPMVRTLRPLRRSIRRLAGARA